MHTIPSNKLSLLQKNAVLDTYHLGIPKDPIRVVPAEQIFETGDFVTP